MLHTTTHLIWIISDLWNTRMGTWRYMLFSQNVNSKESLGSLLYDLFFFLTEERWPKKVVFKKYSMNNLRFYWHWLCVSFLKGTLLFLLQDHHRSTFISGGTVDDHEWQVNWISPGNQYSETLPSLSRGKESLESNNTSRLFSNKSGKHKDVRGKQEAWF